MLVETDDIALLSLFQNKTTRNEGFKGLLNKYSHHIYYFLRRMGLDHEEAGELVQDVFLKFWKTKIIQQKDEPLKIALYVLTAEYCLTFMKNRWVNTFYALAADQQLIIVLKEKEGLNFQEIAQIIAIPVAEVRKKFYTAINAAYRQSVKS